MTTAWDLDGDGAVRRATAAIPTPRAVPHSGATGTSQTASASPTTTAIQRPRWSSRPSSLTVTRTGHPDAETMTRSPPAVPRRDRAAHRQRHRPRGHHPHLRVGPRRRRPVQRRHQRRGLRTMPATGAPAGARPMQTAAAPSPPCLAGPATRRPYRRSPPPRFPRWPAGRVTTGPGPTPGPAACEAATATARQRHRRDREHLLPRVRVAACACACRRHRSRDRDAQRERRNPRPPSRSPSRPRTSRPGRRCPLPPWAPTRTAAP